MITWQYLAMACGSTVLIQWGWHYSHNKRWWRTQRQCAYAAVLYGALVPAAHAIAWRNIPVIFWAMWAVGVWGAFLVSMDFRREAQRIGRTLHTGRVEYEYEGGFAGMKTKMAFTAMLLGLAILGAALPWQPAHAQAPDCGILGWFIGCDGGLRATEQSNDFALEQQRLQAEQAARDLQLQQLQMSRDGQLQTEQMKAQAQLETARLQAEADAQRIEAEKVLQAQRLQAEQMKAQFDNGTLERVNAANNMTAVNLASIQAGAMERLADARKLEAQAQLLAIGGIAVGGIVIGLFILVLEKRRRPQVRMLGGYYPRYTEILRHKGIGYRETDTGLVLYRDGEVVFMPHALLERKEREALRG